MSVGLGGMRAMVPDPRVLAPPSAGTAGGAGPESPAWLFSDESERVVMCGDEPWFADPVIRSRLQEKVIAARKDQLIRVGPPHEEITRIWPGLPQPDDWTRVRTLAYLLGRVGVRNFNPRTKDRQLSRALHPDKNPGVPDAENAFKRLSEAADELRKGLAETRDMLQVLSAVLNLPIATSIVSRPQEVFFATASQLLCGVLSLCGEGHLTSGALQRSAAAFLRCPGNQSCQPQCMLDQWWNNPNVLEIFAGASLRHAYDCAPKRLRAQLLCALHRASIVEAARYNGCVRAGWQHIMRQFPELSLWRELREKLQVRTWPIDESVQAVVSGESGSRGIASVWAEGWRTSIRILFAFPTCSVAIPLTCPGLRQLVVALWGDIAAWAEDGGMQRSLSLFLADESDSCEVASKWGFVPLPDLLLVVGDGLVGINAEGLMFFRGDEGSAIPADANAVQPPCTTNRQCYARVPADLKHYPRPSENDMYEALMSAQSKGYDVDSLPKNIAPGCYWKRGIGLWCKTCESYVAWVQKGKGCTDWKISDDGGCPHFGGTASLGTVSDDDLYRAILVAKERKANAARSQPYTL